MAIHLNVIWEAMIGYIMKYMAFKEKKFYKLIPDRKVKAVLYRI